MPTYDTFSAPLAGGAGQEKNWLAFSPELLAWLKRLAPLFRERAEAITQQRLNKLIPWIETMARDGEPVSNLNQRAALEGLLHPLLLSLLDSWDGQLASLNAYFESSSGIIQTYLAAGVRFQVLLGVTDVQEVTLIEALVDLFQSEAEFSSPAVQIQIVEAILRVHNRQLLTIARIYFAQQEASAIGEREQIIARQRRAIVELSTPIIPVFENILVLPLVGTLDEQRAEIVTEALLMAIVQNQAETIIVDITGLSEMTAQTAAYLVRAAQASRLLGAQIILVGISSRVAMNLVDLGTDLRGINTYGNLQAGFQAALADMGLEIKPSTGKSGEAE
ncbi:MAG: STAS domain-containing protein [Thermoflexales bacterium]|nr:STAS domain-containing protein [Thermoflexales bacterium]